MLPKDWLTRLQQKERRTIAKLITLLAEEKERKEEILCQIYPLSGKSYRVGITGPPGAGKSTLISAWTSYLRQKGLSVAVIAVDPSSPFTSGALLGDRVRMNRHTTDEGVFIRSLSNRGSLGGLSLHAMEVTHLLDAASFDVIFLETVGIGQAEMDIFHTADTVVLVLQPGAGDVVQIAKAGVMEIADLLVVNKADRPFTDKLVAELQDMFAHSSQTKWVPPILRTVAAHHRGMSDLWQAAQQHRKHLQETGLLVAKQKDRLQKEILLYLEEGIQAFLQMELNKLEQQSEIERLLQQKEAPYPFVKKWLEAFCRAVK